ETLTWAGGFAPAAGMANVLSAEKREQVIALGRLGWSLRRIEEATGVRRETAGAYLKTAGVVVRPPGRWGQPPKPAIEVSTDSSARPASNPPPRLRARHRPLPHAARPGHRGRGPPRAHPAPLRAGQHPAQLEPAGRGLGQTPRRCRRRRRAPRSPPPPRPRPPLRAAQLAHAGACEPPRRRGRRVTHVTPR